MSEFKEAPLVTLETMEDVREVLSQPRNNVCGLRGMDIYRVKSVWLIGLIEAIMRQEGRDIAYNAEVKRLAESELGLPLKSPAEYAAEGDTLSLLIYNAQGYRRSDALRAAGCVPLTQELVTQLGEGAKLTTVGGGQELTIRNVAGRLCVMQPRKRKYCVMLTGQPVRVVGPQEVSA